MGEYAKENGRSEDVVEALEKLEASEMQRNVDQRCPVCSDVLKKRPLLSFFWDRARKGEEDNPLLQRFFADERHRPLLQPRYHQLNTLRSIRKEISESYAVLDALDLARDVLGEDGAWHAVDLCCGRSVTAAMLALQHPSVSVSTVDRLEPRFVPHFIAPEEHQRDGNCGLVKYSKLDVLGPTFLQDLDAVLQQANRPTALLGMHLCGFLSIRAVEAFAKLDCVRVVVLSPCCLPGKKEPGVPPELYESKDADEQYRRWAAYLEKCLQEATAGQKISVNSKIVRDILSPKNIVITATKVPNGTTSSLEATYLSLSPSGLVDCTAAVVSQPAKTSELDELSAAVSALVGGGGG